MLAKTMADRLRAGSASHTPRKTERERNEGVPRSPWQPNRNTERATFARVQHDSPRVDSSNRLQCMSLTSIVGLRALPPNVALALSA